jgi:hypothetical protein
VELIRELEQVELLCDRSSLVGEEREVGAQPGAKRAVDVRVVHGDDRDAAVFALDLVLQGDEVAEPDLLLGTPPAANEG